MDLLQVALIFLILLLSIFLAITGFQVFFILRDLKKALDRFNKILMSSEHIAEDIDVDYNSRVEVTSSLVAGLAEGAKALTGIIKKSPKQKQKRFYKKVL